MVTQDEARPPAYLYISEWMEKLELSDEKLAEKLETTRVTVWRWRTEQKRLNPEKMAAIAYAMRLPPEALWHPPGRPSLDALVRDASDEVVKKAADIVAIVITMRK